MSEHLGEQVPPDELTKPLTLIGYSITYFTLLHTSVTSSKVYNDDINGIQKQI